MAEKVLNSRMIQKHDIEANWAKAENFIPKQGEIIIYDIDELHSQERIKIGDGISSVQNLPFLVAEISALPELTFSDFDGEQFTYDGTQPLEIEYVSESSARTIANSVMPTKVSQLTNDSGFITQNGMATENYVNAQISRATEDMVYSNETISTEEIDAICGASLDFEDNLIDEVTNIPYKLYVSEGKLKMTEAN